MNPLYQKIVVDAAFNNLMTKQQTSGVLKEDATLYIRYVIDNPPPNYSGSSRDYAENYIVNHPNEFYNIPDRLIKLIGNQQLQQSYFIPPNPQPISATPNPIVVNPDAEIIARNKELIKGFKEMPIIFPSTPKPEVFSETYPIPLGTVGTVVLREGEHKGEVSYGWYDENNKYYRREPTLDEKIIMGIDKY